MTDLNPNEHNLAASVFQHYSKELQRYLMRRLRGDAQARDLEQEVYLRLLRVSDAQFIQDPQAYMYRIASHVVHEFKQREEKEAFLEFDSRIVEQWEETQIPEAPDPIAEETGRRNEIESAMQKLPDKWKAVMALRLQDDLSHADIAKRLNISAHTVKKHLFKAYIILKDSIRAADR